jgi:protein TonB
MSQDLRLWGCVAGSLILHAALEHGLAQLPPRANVVPHAMEVRVIPPPAEPPPPPPEPPKPEPPPEPPKVAEVPKTRPVHAPQVAAVASSTPAPDHPALQVDSSEAPVFGVTMESTSTQGGPAMPVGNTVRATVDAGVAAAPKPRPAGEPVPEYEATKLPVPQTRCYGKYTAEATAAGTEGSVVFDLIVGEDGRAREIVTTQPLPHGLTEAALATLKECRFSPGEKDGKPVAVKIRGFKVTFALPDKE